jgi:hypothetical protein
MTVARAAAAFGLLACLAPTMAGAQLLVDPKMRSAPAPQNPTNFSRFAVAPWPRLDPGAILCSSRDGFEAHRDALAQRAAGQQVSPLGSADCRVITATTPIDIVSRTAPGQTEVRIKGDTRTGWTDAWLPAQPPR